MAEDNSKSGSRWDVLTQTGAGTPMGELLRRYWWPIAGASEFAEPGTKPVRLLGEDLVLYKDLGGRFGLLDRHCRHRRADLSYGYVEECGLRCNYHGWLYDADGACLAQPYEDMAHPEARLQRRDPHQGLPGRGAGRAALGLSRPGAAAAGAGLGILLLAERLPPDRQGRDPVQLVPVPGELDRPGAFRMDPFELERAARRRAPAPTRRSHVKVDFSEFEYGFQYKRIRTDTDENDRAVDDRPRLPVAERRCSPATTSSSACRSTTRTR